MEFDSSAQIIPLSVIIVTCRDFCLRESDLLIFKMSSSAFLKLEGRKLKMECEQLTNPKPTWEDYKRLKLRSTYK